MVSQGLWFSLEILDVMCQYFMLINILSVINNIMHINMCLNVLDVLNEKKKKYVINPYKGPHYPFTDILRAGKEVEHLTYNERGEGLQCEIQTLRTYAIPFFLH